jgi:hypothetical protein
MPTLDVDQSRKLLVEVVQALYDERHGPVPGAVVKARIIHEAGLRNASFSERELGFKSFVDFVRASPEISLQIRIGSDMLLVPSGATEILSAYAHPLPRLRRDFWRAFIEFPVPNTARLYDEAEDKVFYEDAPSQKDGIPIEPVSRDIQIQWRRQFAEEQPDSTKRELLSALDGSGNAPFNEFARRMRENPAVMKAWNRYFQKLITDHVAAWATTHKIPSDRWSAGATDAYSEGGMNQAGPKHQNISQRAELYNFFDSLPIDDLLQLRVPLEWVLKVTRDKR